MDLKINTYTETLHLAGKVTDFTCQRNLGPGKQRTC